MIWIWKHVENTIKIQILQWIARLYETVYSLAFLVLSKSVLIHQMFYMRYLNDIIYAHYEIWFDDPSFIANY